MTHTMKDNKSDVEKENLKIDKMMKHDETHSSKVIKANQRQTDKDNDRPHNHTPVERARKENNNTKNNEWHKENEGKINASTHNKKQ